MKEIPASISNDDERKWSWQIYRGHDVGTLTSGVTTRVAHHLYNPAMAGCHDRYNMVIYSDSTLSRKTPTTASLI